MTEGLARGVTEQLGFTTHEVLPWFDPEDAYDPSRGQYNSTRLLAMLDRGAGEAFDRVLAVTAADLFVPVLTYVFGEAQLRGRAAVVSLQRLRPEVYGLAADPDRLAQRLLTEACHELGHCDGLLHCHDPRCVMHASTYVEEIDLKTSSRCPDCARAAR
jgi:archaemetzincin